MIQLSGITQHYGVRPVLRKVDFHLDWPVAGKMETQSPHQDCAWTVDQTKLRSAVVKRIDPVAAV